MGYTRYWRRPQELDAERFSRFAAACEAACSELGDSLSGAEFSSEAVRFEGAPGCEPFIVERVSAGRVRDGGVSEFCKTQRMPYDAAVERCLVLLTEFFPEVEVPEPS